MPLKNNIPPPLMQDPIIRHINHAYVHVQSVKGPAFGIHGAQLQAYLQFNKTLRDGRIPHITPIGYTQFTQIYNNHPLATEKWTTISPEGAITVSKTPISHRQFQVEDSK